MVQELEHPRAGRIKVTGIPVNLSSTPGSLRQPPPLLGQHTEEVLSKLLGMDPREIQELRQKGVI
jgi:crotonobetainyl-CoA:carnitine CoA-transferase CaiB-like acyl-CoA transferase